MPWLETAPMEQRTRFIDDWQRGLYTQPEFLMTELCVYRTQFFGHRLTLRRPA